MSAPSERPPRAHVHASFALDPPATSVDQAPSPEAPRTAAELVEFLRGLPPSEEGVRVHKFIEAAPWRHDFFKARNRNLIPHGDNNASSVTALIERVASAYFDGDMRAAGSQEIGQLFKLTVAIDDDRRCREYGGLVHNFIILLQETRDWVFKTGAGIGRLAERLTHSPYGAVSRKRFLDDALARSAEEIQDRLLPLMRAEGYGRYMAHCNRLGLDFTDPEVMSELRDFAVYPDADWLSLTLDRMRDAVERHDAENLADDATALPRAQAGIVLKAEALPSPPPPGDDIAESECPETPANDATMARTGDRKPGGSDADRAPDIEGLPDRIRRQKPRSKLQAELVEFMQNRDCATYLEIAELVYGDDLTEGGAIKQLVYRTNRTLLELQSRVQFRCGAERVFKDTSPE